MKQLAKWWYCYAPRWLKNLVYDVTGWQVIHTRIIRHGPDGEAAAEYCSWNRAYRWSRNKVGGL